MAAEAGTNLRGALDELRELARGLHPSVLETDGLEPALRQLAARSPIPVALSASKERLPDALESTVYFVVAEALANVAKYAHASRADITVERNDSTLRIRVADDGVGGANADGGSGLTGLADRVAALGGTLHVESVAGQGTVVATELPVEVEGNA